MRKFLCLAFMSLLFIGMDGQSLPELIYYKFDQAGTTVSNDAQNPAGTNPAPIFTHSIGASGQFGTALIGQGTNSDTSHVLTGWSPNIGSGSWTISFWHVDSSSSGTNYIFGDNSVNNFRCYSSGSDILVRGGGLNNFVIPNGSLIDPKVIHIVYDIVSGELRGYVDGVLESSALQDRSSVDFTGTDFIVGGYGTTTTFHGLLDEFRVYNRALSAAEIGATWNTALSAVTCTSPPNAGTTVGSKARICKGDSVYIGIDGYS